MQACLRIIRCSLEPSAGNVFAQLMGTAATDKADVWSFGVVLHEICTQEMPVRGGLRPVQLSTASPGPLRHHCVQNNTPWVTGHPSA